MRSGSYAPRHAGDGTVAVKPVSGRRKHSLKNHIYVANLIFALLLVLSVSAFFVYALVHSSSGKYKLPEEVVDSFPGLYSDGAGWIDDEDSFKDACARFYSKTGVIPYLYISVVNTPAQRISKPEFTSMYQHMFKTKDGSVDENRLVITMQWSKSGLKYTEYILGTEARKKISEDEAALLIRRLEKYSFAPSGDEIASALTKVKPIMQNDPVMNIAEYILAALTSAVCIMGMALIIVIAGELRSNLPGNTAREEMKNGNYRQLQ